MTFFTSRFTFIRDALNGTGGFRPNITYDSAGKPIKAENTYLIQYPRESAERFARRNQVSWFTRDMMNACERFVGYLTKQPPVREVNSPLLRLILDDCDWRGNSLEVFFQSFAVEAKARGTMLLLIDMPRTENIPGNQAEQLGNRAVPYLVQIPPERVFDYELNERGRLSSISIHDYMLIDGKQEIVRRIWTNTDWKIERIVSAAGKESTTVVDSGVHNLGVCPVIYFSESGEFMGEGGFSEIADLSKALFNRRSELDEILRSQTFSLMHYHVPIDMAGTFDAAKVSEAVGTHNMLLHYGNAPGFIAPSEGPASTYAAVIDALVLRIREVSMSFETPDYKESGAALTIRFQSLNGALTKFARRMEDFERQMWDIAARWLNVEANASTRWPREYAIANPEREMSVLENMQSTGFPDAVIMAKKRAIIGLEFTTVEPDDLSELINAVNESEHDRGNDNADNVPNISESA